MDSKFNTKQNLVLFNIARARKMVNVDEIINLTGNLLNRKQVLNVIDNLKRRRLIIKEEKNILLNIKNIERIKFILGEHWESNWDSEWRIEVKNNVISP